MVAAPGPVGHSPAQGTVRAAALRVRGLVKRFGALEVLAGVDLDAPAGETLGLVGVNGAGKTTLVKCALDLCGRDGGEIEIFGVPARRPAARSRLLYVPERFVPPHYLRAREFIEMMLALSGARLERERAEALLRDLELDAEVLSRPVRHLSKGMTQKLGLSACFLVERDLYLLDEPMSGLDPTSRVAVKSMLRRLAAEGRTVIFTSHVLPDMEELCAAIALLDRGRIRFHGAPAELRARYGESDLERAFLRCIRDRNVEPARGAA
jgi:ABC-2 type transport system ATP-binding protein